MKWTIGNNPPEIKYRKKCQKSNDEEIEDLSFLSGSLGIGKLNEIIEFPDKYPYEDKNEKVSSQSEKIEKLRTNLR